MISLLFFNVDMLVVCLVAEDIGGVSLEVDPWQARLCKAWC